jgi:hypothetical protein
VSKLSLVAASGEDLRRAAALAHALGSAIDEFNEKASNAQKIKLSTSLGRILDSDPTRPRTKRARKNRPTLDPGVFTLQRYAQQAGTTVGALLGEVQDVLTETDREKMIEFAHWLLSRARQNAARENVLSDVTTRSGKPDNIATFPAKTQPAWTPEFPIHPEDFNDAGDTDFPLEHHSYEGEDLDEAGGDDPVMSTNLLSSREVRTGKLRTVRVRGNDVAPYREGWKLAIDVTQQDPSLIPDKKAIVAYRKDKGTILGRLYHVGARILLRKDDDEKGIDLSDGYKIVGPVDHVAYAKDETPDDDAESSATSAKG